MSTERDPERLSKAASQSPLGRLLASAERDVPSEQQLAELANRLGAVLEPAPAPHAALPGSVTWVKVAVGAGVAALIVGGLWALRRPNAVAPTPKQASSAPVLVAPAVVIAAAPVVPSAPPALSASLVPEATPKPAVSSKPGGEAPRAGSAAEGPSEPVLLEQARRALASSPATALALTNQVAARFPHGVLAQEREVIAIEALRRLGRSAEADRRAAAFASAFPGSAHQRMVEDTAPK